MNILGISAYYHDSAAALIQSGKIVACAQEERFSRVKHDANFPKNAIFYCLQEGKINLDNIDYFVFYEKPLLTFERLIETYLTFAPRGFSSFVKAMPIWLKDKLFLKKTIKNELSKLTGCKKKLASTLLFAQHHQSHAASAFFPSPFDEAAVLCLDGVGEWATTSLWMGKGNYLQPKWEIRFPHSLGLLYSAFTYFTGFKVNSGEYKLMGLAPYGEPKYVDLILENLIHIKNDGSFRLNMDYFDYAVGLRMTNERFSNLFGRPPRQPEAEITQLDMDIARSIQVVTEEIVLRLAKSIRNEFGSENLCMAGGVALNCVANGRILKEKIFKKLWVQPAAGDAGGALGAALLVWFEHLKNTRVTDKFDSMHGSYLGPSFSNEEIKAYLDKRKVNYHVLSDKSLFERVAHLLDQQKVVGWFQGRMEYGPRALGNRSILGDARNPEMQSKLNLKIKFRESFRPFAPAVLFEHCKDWFDLDTCSPYMLFVANVNKKKFAQNIEQKSYGLDKLKVVRTAIPAVTHVDYSARVQTVHSSTNPRFYQLINRFASLTQCPVLINTSFNVRGEPIVCSPDEAFQCFMGTHMDCLVLENILIFKEEQSPELTVEYTQGEKICED